MDVQNTFKNSSFDPEAATAFEYVLGRNHFVNLELQFGGKMVVKATV